MTKPRKNMLTQDLSSRQTEQIDLSQIARTGPLEVDVNSSIYIIADENIQLIVRVLNVGRDHAKTRFPAHTGLLILLGKDYRENREAQFLEHLKMYLTQIRWHVPGAPTKERATAVLNRVRSLIEVYGLEPIARIILARMLV